MITRLPVPAAVSSLIPVVLVKLGPLDRDRIADLRPYFDSVRDPRSRRGRWYSLTAILLVSACAVVSGASVGVHPGVVRQVHGYVPSLRRQHTGCARLLTPPPRSRSKTAALWPTRVHATGHTGQSLLLLQPRSAQP
ncbi:transposase family protein [Streptomyces melanosporofaciens]|uniref:transposase family protein n=1 Tax=Streptomyces melanosporofaciens TaxID=67327 RepID=UPI001FCBCC8C|nr:transposase family protein [Streptomyces melanosporofaciens]